METPVAETPPAAEKPIAVDAAAPTPTQPRKSNWVDWALFAGGDTLAALGLLGYLGAINSVNQANAMDFSALNAEANYKSQVAQARSARFLIVVSETGHRYGSRHQHAARGKGDGAGHFG